MKIRNMGKRVLIAVLAVLALPTSALAQQGAGGFCQKALPDRVVAIRCVHFDPSRTSGLCEGAGKIVKEALIGHKIGPGGPVKDPSILVTVIPEAAPVTSGATKPVAFALVAAVVNYWRGSGVAIRGAMAWLGRKAPCLFANRTFYLATLVFDRPEHSSGSVVVFWRGVFHQGGGMTLERVVFGLSARSLTTTLPKYVHSGGSILPAKD